MLSTLVLSNENRTHYGREARLFRWEGCHPQYEYKFTEKTINKEAWDAMQKKAAELWLEGDGAKRVRNHWRSIMEGNVPFGYKVEN